MDIEYTKEMVTKRIQNQDIFDSIDYDFRFFYSLEFGTVKLSRDKIAFLRREDRELYILDGDKCNKIYDDFMLFVKSIINGLFHYIIIILSTAYMKLI